MKEKEEEVLTISEICLKGKENFKKMGVEWLYPGGKVGTSVAANRRLLDYLFFEPNFFDPLPADTSFTLFGRKFDTPVFCSAISRRPYMSETSLPEIAAGVAGAGSFIMLGIGGSSELQAAIDTGAPVVKIVKPYQNMELIYKKVRDAEKRGCVAVGMDVDHSFGMLMKDRVMNTKLFGPQNTEELKQLISQSKLPFVFKGVLSVSDAQKALDLGASAIVVSNHGSGAFDFTIPSMMALPKIVEKIGAELAVLLDTGFETGNDVFKGLAFGAKGVGFASSMVLAHAADGARGVELLIHQITSELRRTMSATGCKDLTEINRAIIHQIGPME
ncbi:MAG: alpha-hydroxy acid oxidase [Pseudomonadota bacterium]